MHQGCLALAIASGTECGTGDGLAGMPFKGSKDDCGCEMSSQTQCLLFKYSGTC